MAKLRKENGREKPWKVKFFGVGNESWGTPELKAVYGFGYKMVVE